MHRTRGFIIAVLFTVAAVALSQQGTKAVLAASYAPGWNLISAPEGSHVRGATGSLYTWQPGDASYEVVPVTAALKGRYGYWAYFPAGGSFDAGSGGGDTSINLVEGQWAMVGNPSNSTAATLAGATAAYTYSPSDGYVAAVSILPGQGAWVRGSGLLVITPVGDTASGSPAPVSAAPAAPSQTAAPTLTGPAHFAGALTIESRPALVGTVVQAFVGDTVCGSQTISEAGRYSLDVAPATTTPGCGQQGAPLQFSITPPFGSGWRLETSVTFQPGQSVQRDIAVDLTHLKPDASNVPWTMGQWANPRSIGFSLCSSMSRAATSAAQGAFQQWREASQSLGLREALTSDTSGAVCNQGSPGIVVIEDTIADASVIAATGYLDANSKPCRKTTPCSIYTAVIIVNRSTFASISGLDQPNVIAHEIGHALGLGHALACDGGTIMWADDRCRYPLEHIGVDDIASLNAKLGGASFDDGAAYASTADGMHIVNGSASGDVPIGFTDNEPLPEPVEIGADSLHNLVEVTPLTLQEWYGTSSGGHSAAIR